MPYRRDLEAERERRKTWPSNARQRDPEAIRRRNLMFWHKLTPEEFDALEEAQGAVCLLCGKPNLKRRLNIDHSHETGERRGLLCNRCNMALGMFDDDPALLRKAANFVEGETRVDISPLSVEELDSSFS